MKTTRFKLMLLVALLSGSLEAWSQLQSWEIGLVNHNSKTIKNSNEYTRKLFIAGAAIRGHASIIDKIRDGREKKLRFGDYFGAAFGTGYAKETTGSPDDLNELGTMWMTIDIQAGIQGGYTLNDDLAVGLRGYREVQFIWMPMSSAIDSKFMNMAGPYVRYKRFYANLDIGWNWKADRSGTDGFDRTTRMNFKFFTNDKGMNLGLRIDVAQRYWEEIRTDRKTALELSIGKML